MIIAEAQAELRRAFVGGGPGALVSALVWLAAGLVERAQGVALAFALLFIGGMLIFPLSTLCCRLLFRRAKESGGNSLGRVALESTIAMIGGLLAAWLFLPHEPDHVFPLAAIAVGTHYAAFRTVYGDATFWLLAALIAGVGCIDIFDVVRIPGGVILTVRSRNIA